MKLQVVGKNNVKISETIRAYVEKKVDKLGRYLPNLDEGWVLSLIHISEPTRPY